MADTIPPTAPSPPETVTPAPSTPETPAPAAPRRKAGRPPKWIAPPAGEPMSTAMKQALANRAWTAKYVEANREVILERTRLNYHKRRAKIVAALKFMKEATQNASESAT